MDSKVIAQVQGFGFDVYMRDIDDTWLIFTDGVRIGYLQAERFGGYSFSTVHVPNTSTGTGFQVGRHEDQFTKQDLEMCFLHAPDWARGDLKSVTKWRDIQHYLSASSFNKKYGLMPKET